MKNYVAGHYIKQKEYKTFIPSLVNKEFMISDSRIIALLETASRFIGELNAYSKNLPNIQSFLFMLAMEEATISNKIEGTKITLNEVISPEENLIPEKRDELDEVINYLFALEMSCKRLTGIKDILTNPHKSTEDTLPFSTRLIKETHKNLLTNSRGSSKNPGEFRTSQNWIGGNMPSTAAFVPPPSEYLSELLSDFENFWHNESINIPILIKIAISHYQFETIHPFLDGNGRIGRLIILLQLIDSKILELPTLYLSKYFESNRKEYYDALSLVREKNDISQWIKYFLTGICDISMYTVEKLKKIDNLNNQCKEKIKKFVRSRNNAEKLLNYLYQKPIITTKDIEGELETNYQVANNLIKSFVKNGILTCKKQKRNKTYVFSDYLRIFV